MPSLFVIAVVAAAIYAVKRWQSLPEDQRKGFGQKTAIYAALAAVLILVVTGKAHWLMGVLAALLAIAGRLVQFMPYVPLFKKLMGEQEQGQPGQPRPAQSEMTRQEAADILGVGVDASVDEVRQAHKRLIQKLHPDRGGSDVLAKQINLAKDILLD